LETKDSWQVSTQLILSNSSVFLERSSSRKLYVVEILFLALGMSSPCIDSLTEERRSVFGNRVLRGILGLRGEDEAGGGDEKLQIRSFVIFID
jgi:hypothetical protein